MALAGCATQDNGEGGDGADTNGGGRAGPALTEAQARDLLRESAQDFPEQFALEIKVEKGSRQLMSAKGSFNNATQSSYLEFKVDPAAFNDSGSEMGMGAALFQEGFAIYSTARGSVWISNGTAYVFPASDDNNEGAGGFQPDPEETPFGSFFTPEDFASAFADENVTVTSVTPVTYRNQPAVRLTATTQAEDGPSEATIIVFTQTQRIAHIEAEIPAEGDDAADPFQGGVATLEFYYNGEVDVVVPAAATRSFGLTYKSDANPFSWGDDSDKPTTWTFLVDSDIALGEVEVQVKDTEAGAEDDTGETQLAEVPTLWSMRLSDGTKTQDGVTITFHDADGNSRVSAGDSLVIEAEEDAEMPTVVLYDTVSGTYVVPGPAFMLLLAGLGAAALLLRRRA